MSFAGQTIWITGASSGIGEALAYALAERGAHLLLSARRAERLEAVRQACAHPERHRVVPLDLGQPEALFGVADAALADVKTLDMVIHNGGLSQRARAAETDFAVDRRLIEVDYLGPVALTKAVLPRMLAQGHGHLVVVSSLVGKFGTPLRSGYAGAKHALHGFFDSLRAEVADAGLAVTLVCPGFIRTQVSVNALTADGSALGEMNDAQANGMPADVFAEKMLAALAARKAEVYIGGREKVGIYVKRFFPSLFNRLIRRAKVT